MEFSSISFLWLFLPMSILGCYLLSLIPGISLKNDIKTAFLVLLSLLFCAFGGIRSLAIIVTIAFANYYLGIVIEKNRRKIVFRLAVLFNISLLILFKYSGMLTGFFNATRGLMHSSKESLRSFLLSSPVSSIILPLGLSFLIFQSISYLTDIFRGNIKAERNILRFLLYTFFFVQYVQGPILRYKDFSSRLNRNHVDASDVSEGITRFCLGLSKKVLIADTLAPVVAGVWSRTGEAVSYGRNISTAEAWMGSILFTMQIYYDFSGYSDMAVGLGRIFGFIIPENFNRPYVSQSVQEFWKRWHMTLSSWFRDYVYIPLGGNRLGKARTLANLLIVFLITGIWHGANITFIVWGVFHGLFSILERLFLGNWLKKCKLKPLCWFYTFFVVNLGWVFFRSPNIYLAFRYITSMFTIVPIEINTSILSYIDVNVLLSFAAGFALSVIPAKTESLNSKLFSNRQSSFITSIVSLLLFFWSILVIISGSYSPSIYAAF